MPNTTDIFADDFNDHDQLVNRLKNKTEVLKTPRIIDAFKHVDRKDFVRTDLAVEAYEDYPLPIGDDQTISQPTTVAFMLELLAPEEGDSILDVGSGSGWTTALLAEIVGSNGRVVGVEVIEDLVEFGLDNLAQYNFAQAEIQHSDGGAPQVNEAPFDRILVSAAADEIPDGFISQLKNNGVIVIPIDDSIVRATKVPRGDGYQLKRQIHHGFRFVDFKHA